MKSRLKHWRRKPITNDRLRSAQKSKPLIGYMRVRKADGWQVFDLQRDALVSAGVRLAAAAMGNPETNVARLCEELGISSQTLYRQTLYRYVSPAGALRADAMKTLNGSTPIV